MLEDVSVMSLLEWYAYISTHSC